MSTCGEPVALGLDALSPSLCSESQNGKRGFVSLLSDVEVSICEKSESTLLKLEGDGILAVEAVYSIYYSYDTASTAEFFHSSGDSRSGVLRVTLMPNTSGVSSWGRDPYAIALMVATTNAPTKVRPSHPSIRIDFDGYSMAQSQKIATTDGRGIMASGQTLLPNVSFWDAGKRVPQDDLAFYPAGEESYVVVNSNMLDRIDKVMKITFDSVELNKDTDRLFLIDGDSLVSSRVCMIATKSRACGMISRTDLNAHRHGRCGLQPTAMGPTPGAQELLY